MSHLLCRALGLFVSLASFALHAADPPAALEAVKWRTLDVLLIKTNGTPAPGVDVQLFGLERDTVGKMANYRSDAEGRFTVKFAEFPANELYELTGKNLPGWGVFHLFAETPQDGNALSPQLINARPEEQGDRDSLGGRQWGKFALASGRTKLTLKLHPGVTLSGHVLDIKGRPLAGVGVGVHTDLHRFSHTGYGGEIFENHTITDADGRFTLSGIFPGQFHVGVTNGETPVYWIRTKVRSKWREEIVDEITPKKGERELAMRIILSSEKLYRYFGRVTDFAGKPVPGAVVTAGISRHRLVTTWGDDHHYEDTITDEDGRYELMTSTPFSRGFSVKAAGFERADKWKDDEDETYAPGKYNYRLKRAGAADSK